MMMPPGQPPQGPPPQGPPVENQAMAGAFEPVAPKGAPVGDPSTPMPAIPPELVEMAYALGIDINDPEQLAMLLQILGQGGGGPLGPMAGAPPGGGPGPAVPEEY